MSNNISAAAEKDINELESKISQFKSGAIPEERFKAFRLTRGVYGQRQSGVQMLRIKLPYGKITTAQLHRLADLSEEYTNGKLHLTTRQNVQFHYVHVEDSPAIWRSLEEVGITTREACGNTVRNVTASPLAGIDKDEPFDVAPYAEAVFEYFLRNPICQDLGRKIKIAFSSSQKDSAFTYIHDFGFIPVLQENDGHFARGFKVLVGGGLGAQAFAAQVAKEFLPENELIPFIEAGLRVFERYGERERRHKARLKFLIDPKNGIGLDRFLELVGEQQRSLPYQTFEIAADDNATELPTFIQTERLAIKDLKAFRIWRDANVAEQKQEGYHIAKVKIPNGNLTAETARKLSNIARKYAADDLRLSLNQGIILKFLKEENLINLYAELNEIGLGRSGFDSLGDVTSCPGTDTCNLGVTNSFALSEVLDTVIKDEYSHLIGDSHLKIKISGCMNSCGQHMVAQIGLHGSSLKFQGKVAPAMQIVLGGGVDESGKGLIAEKVIKVPTKRIPDALRLLLDDYESNGANLYFNEYFQKKGKLYFYSLLKPLADLSTLTDEQFQDWGKVEDFVPEIGVGECAGVALDLISTILGDAKERLHWASEALELKKYTDSIFWSHNAIVIGAKAILLSRDFKCNTYSGIIQDFNEHVYAKGEVALKRPFEELANLISEIEPSNDFANQYFEEASDFIEAIAKLSQREADVKQGKLVVSNYYNA